MKQRIYNINKNELYPKFLYHYTSVETLELILKSMKIRFNSLSNVDDYEEQMTEDMNIFGRFCFISCWTDKAVESKELWDKYGGKGKGLRIKLPVYPFKTRFIFLSHGQYESYFKGSEMKNEKYIIMNDANLLKNILVKVEYTNDKKKIIPNIIKEKNENNVIINTNLVGVYKRDIWDSQNEWRYRFVILPINYKDFDFNITKTLEEFKKTKDLPFTDYFLELDRSKVNGIEILLGPNTSTLDFNSVNKILVQNNIKGTVFNSTIEKY